MAAAREGHMEGVMRHSGVRQLEVDPSGHSEPLREQSEADQERMTRRKSGLSQSEIDPTGHSKPLKEQSEADQERSQSEIGPTGEVKEALYLQEEHADQNEHLKTQKEAHQATYWK